MSTEQAMKPNEPKRPASPPGRGPRGPAKPPRAKGPQAVRQPDGKRPPARGERPPAGLWLYGHHAVLAALRNPRRTVHQLLGTEEGLGALDGARRRPNLRIVPARADDLARVLPRGVQHQGVALQVAPLPPLQVERVLAVQPERSTVLVLDQVTDPRNFGAILRSAAALGVGAVIVPERRSAELGGAAAKAASGALDIVPIAEVVNLARAIERLKAAGYWISGLDGEAERSIEDSRPTKRRAVVLGSEGSGIRRLVGEACDEILKIPIEPRMESLNVSVAAAVALYALRARDRS